MSCDNEIFNSTYNAINLIEDTFQKSNPNWIPEIFSNCTYLAHTQLEFFITNS